MRQAFIAGIHLNEKSCLRLDGSFEMLFLITLNQYNYSVGVASEC